LEKKGRFLAFLLPTSPLWKRGARGDFGKPSFEKFRLTMLFLTGYRLSVFQVPSSKSPCIPLYERGIFSAPLAKRGRF